MYLWWEDRLLSYFEHAYFDGDIMSVVHFRVLQTSEKTAYLKSLLQAW